MEARPKTTMFRTGLNQQPNSLNQEQFEHLLPIHVAVKEIEQYLDLDIPASLETKVIELSDSNYDLGFADGTLVYVDLTEKVIYSLALGLGANAIFRSPSSVQLVSGRAKSPVELIANSSVWLLVETGEITMTPNPDNALQYLGQAINSSDLHFVKHAIMPKP